MCDAGHIILNFSFVCILASEVVCQNTAQLPRISNDTTLKCSYDLSIGWQKCSHCGRFGASVACAAADCDRIYHYPCAAAAATYQDGTNMKLYCEQHDKLAQDLGEYDEATLFPDPFAVN